MQGRSLDPPKFWLDLTDIMIGLVAYTRRDLPA